MQELAASYPGIDAAARLAEPDGRCVYVLVEGWAEESLSRLRSCLNELDAGWPKLIYIAGDPAQGAEG